MSDYEKQCDLCQSVFISKNYNDYLCSSCKSHNENGGDFIFNGNSYEKDNNNNIKIYELQEELYDQYDRELDYDGMLLDPEFDLFDHEKKETIFYNLKEILDFFNIKEEFIKKFSDIYLESNDYKLNDFIENYIEFIIDITTPFKDKLSNTILDWQYKCPRKVFPMNILHRI